MSARGCRRPDDSGRILGPGGWVGAAVSAGLQRWASLAGSEAVTTGGRFHPREMGIGWRQSAGVACVTGSARPIRRGVRHGRLCRWSLQAARRGWG